MSGDGRALPDSDAPTPRGAPTSRARSTAGVEEAERSFCARLFDWHRRHALKTSMSLEHKRRSALTVRAPFFCAPDDDGVLWLTGLADPDDLDALLEEGHDPNPSHRLMFLTFAAAFQLPCASPRVRQAAVRVYMAGAREELAGVRAYLAALEEDRLTDALPLTDTPRPKPPRL